MRYLIAVAILTFLVYCTIAFVTATRPNATGPPSNTDGAGNATAEGAPSPEWAGAEACAACHKELYETWAKTAHALTIRDFEPEMSAVPFDGGVFETRTIDHRMGPGPKMPKPWLAPW